MAIWFPALRASLVKRLGPYLPPHPMRSLTGAALAALLLWTVGGALYAVGTGVQYVWVSVVEVATSVGEALKSVPRVTETALVGQDQSVPPVTETVPPATEPVPATPEPTPSGRQPLPPQSAASLGVRNTVPIPLPIITGTPTVRESLQTFELPYVEGPGATLTDASRQLDYALSQTFLRLGMDFSRLELLQSQWRTRPADSVKPATAGSQAYPFQRMRVHLSGTEADFIAALESSLEAWTEGASLEQTRKDGRAMVRLLANGLPTHEVYLKPTGSVFVQPPQMGEPRLTIVIDDMGADINALRELLALDVPITFAIIPSTAHAAQTAQTAAAAGQEVLLHQPMEPMQAPYVTPGPHALLLSMTPDAMRDTLRRNFARFPEIVGLNNHMGSRVTQNRAACRLVAEEAAAAGLFTLDSVTIPSSVFYEEASATGLVSYRRDFFLDDQNPGQRAILNTLKQAEQAAQRTGQAIVIGHPRPDTIAALKDWVHQRNPNVAIVPLRYQ